MTLVPGVPNIRVIIREASDENLVVGVPNISVKILDGDQYNVNMTANSVTTLRTGSFSTYADSAGFAQTASYALVAQTLIGSIESASYAYTASVAISSSYATSASYAPTILPSGIISSSTQVDYTQIQNQPTTIPTASYVLNAVSSSFATTSSYALNAGAGSGFPFSGSAVITGSLLVSQSGVVISGALNVTQGITGSLNGNADTATTASYVNYNNVDGKPSLISSSLQINTGSFSGSFTGTLLGTASWATNTISSSYAQTSSLAYQVSVYTGSVASGSVSYTGSFTGSFIGDGALLTNVASCIVSGSPPTSNVETGDLWYDDDTGKTYIYYTSASVSSWVLQADPTYDPGTIIQAATASLALAIPMSAPVTPQTGSLYFSGSYLFIYDGTQYKSASLN